MEDKFFQQAFGQPFGRHGLPAEIFQLAEGLQLESILVFFLFKVFGLRSRSLSGDPLWLLRWMGGPSGLMRSSSIL